jgi:hypothetical protein
MVTAKNPSSPVSVPADDNQQPAISEPRPRRAGKVSRSYLINKLNYVNFMNGTLDIILSHNRYDRKIAFKAYPMPCEGERLFCRWKSPDRVAAAKATYCVDHFFLTDGAKALKVTPTACRLTEDGVDFDLPERCLEIRNRRDIRYSCPSIPIQVIQNSMLFKGSLLEFSTASFQVELEAKPPQTFQCIDANLPLEIFVTVDDEMVYSGTFSIIKQGGGRYTRLFVLAPRNESLHRFNPRAFRSTRLRLVPSPNILFRHPLTGNTVNLKVVDISGSGMSVSERQGGSILLPGLILPEVELSFAGILHIRFKAQVVHRNLIEENESNGDAFSGLAILDMDRNEHLKLLAILHQAENERSYINNEVDMDALWDFFFETGFIYPKKYKYIEENKEVIKQTYWKLYTQNPTIARHFIYQDKGLILGHMAMVRIYENTWLIHHHAARKREQIRAGINVLHQIGRFGYDSHRLYSMHMKYLICYFRPENHFPNSVFGGFARHNNNPDACSMDAFAYTHFNPHADVDEPLADGWELAPCTPTDIRELAIWYDHHSGGLTLDALDLDPQTFDSDQVIREYHRLGFTKQRTLFALRRRHHLCALFSIHQSDIGLNMSDLTHCVKVFVLDTQVMGAETLRSALKEALRQMDLSEMPILIFPQSYADQEAIPYEKIYNLWVINIRFSDHYFEFVDRIFKRTRG